MEGITNLLFLALFVGLTSKVSVEQPCSISNLRISEVATGAKIENKPQWNVTVSNDCICTQSNIEFACSGFRTVEKIDPQILSVEDNVCAFHKDGVLRGFTNATFSYAWDTRFPFKPTFSNIACS